MLLFQFCSGYLGTAEVTLRLPRRARRVLGACSARARRVLGACSARARRVLGACSARARRVLGACSARARRVLGACSAYAGNTRQGPAVYVMPVEEESSTAQRQGFAK